MKNLVGKVVTKKVPFCGDEVEIRKLSVSEVLKVQEIVKIAQKSKKDNSELSIIRDVLRLAVIDAEEMSDADFDTFPLGELANLSEEILNYSGLGTAGNKLGN